MEKDKNIKCKGTIDVNALLKLMKITVILLEYVKSAGVDVIEYIFSIEKPHLDKRISRRLA